MNTKNKILIGVLVVFLLAIVLRVLTSQNIFVVAPAMKIHAGADGCVPVIVDHIAVNNNVYFAQESDIMYLVDTNRRLISHLNTDLEDFTRHIYSDEILFDKGEEGKETVALKWIDGNVAEFEFLYENESDRKSCTLRVDEQWASQSGADRLEAAAAGSGV